MMMRITNYDDDDNYDDGDDDNYDYDDDQMIKVPAEDAGYGALEQPAAEVKMMLITVLKSMEILKMSHPDIYQKSLRWF